LLIAYSLRADGFETAPALRSITVRTAFIRSNVHLGGWCRPAQRRGNTREDASISAFTDTVIDERKAGSLPVLVQSPLQLAPGRMRNLRGYMSATITLFSPASIPARRSGDAS
jgi:hypothetical protein